MLLNLEFICLLLYLFIRNRTHHLIEKWNIIAAEEVERESQEKLIKFNY